MWILWYEPKILIFLHCWLSVSFNKKLVLGIYPFLYVSSLSSYDLHRLTLHVGRCHIFCNWMPTLHPKIDIISSRWLPHAWHIIQQESATCSSHFYSKKEPTCYYPCPEKPRKKVHFQPWRATTSSQTLLQVSFLFSTLRNLCEDGSI